MVDWISSWEIRNCTWMNLFKISYSWLEFSDNSIENHWPYTIFQYIKAFESQKKTEKDQKWTARVCHNLVEHVKSSLSNLWQIMLEICIEVETLQSLTIYWNWNCTNFLGSNYCSHQNDVSTSPRLQVDWIVSELWEREWWKWQIDDLLFTCQVCHWNLTRGFCAPIRFHVRYLNKSIH